MRIENDGETQRIVFDVQASPYGTASIKLIPGQAPSGLYMWIGADHDNLFIGSLRGAELRRLARTIMREFDRKGNRKKARR